MRLGSRAYLLASFHICSHIRISLTRGMFRAPPYVGTFIPRQTIKVCEAVECNFGMHPVDRVLFTPSFRSPVSLFSPSSRSSHVAFPHSPGSPACCTFQSPASAHPALLPTMQNHIAPNTTHWSPFLLVLYNIVHHRAISDIIEYAFKCELNRALASWPLI